MRKHRDTVWTAAAGAAATLKVLDMAPRKISEEERARAAEQSAATTARVREVLKAFRKKPL